jgi:hypothetical protein
MASINFPSSPTNGQEFTSGDFTWIFSSTGAGGPGAWKLKASPAQSPYWFIESDATKNIGIGELALEARTTAERGIGLGYASMYNITTGVRNIGIGTFVLGKLTTGERNTAVGDVCAWFSNGNRNTIAGNSSYYNSTTGDENVAIGYAAMSRWAPAYYDYYGTGSTGSLNVAIGAKALWFAGTGSNNVGMGHSAGYNLDTGSNNIFIGKDAGNSGTNNFATGSNSIIIGYNASSTSSSVSNEITLGNSSIATLRCQVTSITSLSDERDKQDIYPLRFGLDFIDTLEPVEFTWMMRDGGKFGIKDIGFLAQDLIEAEDAVDAHDYLQLTYRNNPERLEASYGRLVPMLVKAVQELSAKVKELELKQ